MCKVADILSSHGWMWPDEWIIKFPAFNDIPIPQLTETIWLEADGHEAEFSASIAWESFQHRDSQVEWEKVVWFPNCVPRFSILVWLLIRKALKTQDKLKAWDRGGNVVSCVFCAQQPDSHDHLFFECPYSMQVWQMLCPYTKIPGNCFRWADIVNCL